MKNLVQNSLVAVALLLCLVMGFFINVIFAGFAIAIFIYLVYKMTKKVNLAYLFVVLPIIAFNAYSYYYLTVKEPEHIQYFYKVLEVVNTNTIFYEVKHNDKITIKKIKDSKLATECENIGCNYISINEKIVRVPEWFMNNYSKFSLIDILNGYNNSNKNSYDITVSKLTDITDNFETK